MTEAQIRRYARHVLLPDVGGKGQTRILASRARVEHAAGAGEGAILYLAAAGVGTIVVCDRGTVERAGLLYEGSDVGRSRFEAVRERVAAMNPDVTIVADGDGVVVALGDAADPAAQLEAGARAARRALEEILA